MGFDLISFSFPSPPAPSSRVTRGRLGDESAAIPLTIGIRKPSFADKESETDSAESRDEFTLLGNCSPAPPLSQHFALNEK